MGRALRSHIGIFGRRNNGKSSLINALADQNIAIVSNLPGTTTDPVRKVMEVEGVGPTVFIDTAGIDDEGELGSKRIAKSMKIIKIIDAAILVITSNVFGEYEERLIDEFKKFNTPFFVVHNKSDEVKLTEAAHSLISDQYQCDIVDFSAMESKTTDSITDLIRKNTPLSSFKKPSILGDLVSDGDIVVLVTPCDSEAPEGRLILPQVQTIRDILDNNCISVVLAETELETYLKSIKQPPKLIVTDSQVFEFVSSIVPKNVPLTSFSILFARMKGDFETFATGTPKLSSLKDGDKVLILESCSHHVTCDDIGRVKIPNWLSKFSGKELEYKVVAGLDDLPDIKHYAIVIQCGGCVVTRKQVLNRMKPAIDAGIPVTNYGMAISYIHGIYDRVMEPFQK